VSVLLALQGGEITVAAQPHYGSDDVELLFPDDTWGQRGQGFYTGPIFFPRDELYAAQPLAEQPWFADTETENYDDTSTLDDTPTLFPSVVAEPVETFAAQPHFGDDFDTYAPDEVEDYTTLPEQLEFLAPPEIIVPEIIAAQPQSEVEWTQTELEDYANDTALDVTPQLFPPVVAEPIETFAAQPLAEQTWFDAEALEDYQAAPEQLEFLAPPEAPTTELIASAPHYGEAFWPDQETEDYQADSTLDPTPTLFPTTAEAIEVFAAQPYYGEWWWDDQPTEDYAADATLDVAPHLAAGVEPAETLLAAGYTPTPDVEPADTLEDYQHTSTLDVSALTFAVAGITEIVPSYSTVHELVDALIAEALEDYQHTSTLELVGVFAAPAPSAVYLTEGDADATVGMQATDAIGTALEHDNDASVGAEADDAGGGGIEGDADSITGLES